MNYSDLFEKGVENFITEAFEPQSPIIYTHIPKCAGTSSIESIKSVFDQVWHFEFDKIESTWDQFLSRLQDSSYRPLEFSAGHFWPNEMNRLVESGIPHHGITFLRHPIDRIISQYRYMISDSHPERDDFISKYKSFDEYIEKFVHEDAIAWMLFYGVESVDEYYEKLQQRFRFIGLSEYYHISMAILFECIGKPYRVEPKLNVADLRPQYDFELTHNAVERLHESQAMDIEVFEQIYLEYSGIVDSFFEWHLKKIEFQNAADGAVENVAAHAK